MISDATPPMRIHFCQSVEGALNHWKMSEWKAIAKENNMTVKQVKDEFKKYLSEGKKVIPIGECDNFSYEHGCRGHIVREGLK